MLNHPRKLVIGSLSGFLISLACLGALFTGALRPLVRGGRLRCGIRSPVMPSPRALSKSCYISISTSAEENLVNQIERQRACRAWRMHASGECLLSGRSAQKFLHYFAI